MRIAIIGSTGRTGIEITRQALGAGYHVTALARTPEKMPFEHPALRIYQGDALLCDAVEVVKDSDVVIIAIGGTFLQDGSTRSHATERFIHGMQNYGPKRLIVISSAGVGDSYEQLSQEGKNVVDKVIRVAVDDHERQETLVRESGLDWTILRPGGLTTDALQSYQADATGTVAITSISRASVADFALAAIGNQATIGQIYTFATERGDAVPTTR